MIHYTINTILEHFGVVWVGLCVFVFYSLHKCRKCCKYSNNIDSLDCTLVCIYIHTNFTNTGWVDVQVQSSNQSYQYPRRLGGEDCVQDYRERREFR